MERFNGAETYAKPFGEAKRLLTKVFRWYQAEIEACVPEIARRYLNLGPPKYLTISAIDDSVLLKTEASEEAIILPKTSVGSARSRAALMASVEHVNEKSDQTKVGLKLNIDEIFERNFLIPARARQRFDIAMLEQELNWKTPFSPAEVFHDYEVSAPDQSERCIVIHRIVRRAFVETAARACGVDIDDIDFVYCAARDGRAESRLWLRNSGRIQRLPKIEMCFLASAVFLMILNPVAVYWRQYLAIEQLNARLFDARVAAEHARMKIDKSRSIDQALRQLSEREMVGLPIVGIWGALSRILPDDTWLDEIRIEDIESGQRQVSISGYSRSAAALVPLLNRSARFSNTSLTSAVAFQTADDREKFALHAVANPNGTGPDAQ